MVIIRMRTQTVRCYAENLGSLSEKGIDSIAAIRKIKACNQMTFTRSSRLGLWLSFIENGCRGYSYMVMVTYRCVLKRLLWLHIEVF